MLVVIAIIGVLASMLMGVVSKSLDSGGNATCQNNLHQIGVALTVYSDNYDGKGPYATSVCYWDSTPYGWMQQVFSYVGNEQLYACPKLERTKYAYFLGAYAAYKEAGDRFASVRRSAIQYPSCFVAGGDITQEMFLSDDGNRDCDKDDYTQNALLEGTPVHGPMFNALFADNHAAMFGAYDPGKMTFRYHTMSAWGE